MITRELLYKRALRALSYGDHTPQGLYFKLISVEGSDHGDAKEVIKQLHREGFIDEKRYYVNLIEEGKRKLWGRRKFESELKKRRFNEKYLAAFKAEEIDWLSMARELIRNESDAPRAYRRLVSKGYDPQVASSAVSSCQED